MNKFNDFSPDKILGRPPTEDEVYSTGKAWWCIVCENQNCQLRGHDVLMVCDSFIGKENYKPDEKAPEKDMDMKKENEHIVSEDENMDIIPEDENMDVETARGLTKLNFEKACVDIYSQIVATIRHNAKLGMSECQEELYADENILAWLDEKLSGKGFEVEWDQDTNNPFKVTYHVKWYEEGHE